MRRLVAATIALSLGHVVAADQVSEYNAALAKWQAAGIHNYKFTYEWNGAVVFAPACADATIQVQVKGGIGGSPKVVRGNPRCLRGTRGVKAIGFSVPATIDDAFRDMVRYIADTATSVHITVSYDSTYGFPKAYFVEKLEIEDNDEGFKITSFKVTK